MELCVVSKIESFTLSPEEKGITFRGKIEFLDTKYLTPASCFASQRSFLRPNRNSKTFMHPCCFGIEHVENMSRLKVNQVNVVEVCVYGVAVK